MYNSHKTETNENTPLLSPKIYSISPNNDTSQSTAMKLPINSNPNCIPIQNSSVEKLVLPTLNSPNKQTDETISVITPDGNLI